MAEIKQAHEVCMDAVIEAAKASAVAANAVRRTDSNASRVCDDVADLCWFAASLMSRGSHYMALFLRGLAEALELTARDCGRHQVWHQQKCAEACGEAARECRRLLGELPVEGIAHGQYGHLGPRA